MPGRPESLGLGSDQVSSIEISDGAGDRLKCVKYSQAQSGQAILDVYHIELSEI